MFTFANFISSINKPERSDAFMIYVIGIIIILLICQGRLSRVWLGVGLDQKTYLGTA